ncbi:hypothetical protein PRNP1_006833 [Phytophthora ramorum]
MLSWLVESTTKWTYAAHGAANAISHPNRDVTELVEQYRAERDAFDAEQCDESDEDEDAEGNAASAAARPTAAKPWSVKVFYQLESDTASKKSRLKQWPSSPTPPSHSCTHVNYNDEANTKREDVERRRSWLSTTSAPKHRERHVFLNLDATAASLTMSRLLFAPLQTPSAGTTKTSLHISQALEKFEWILKADNVLQAQLLTQLQKGAAAANAKKLVLAMGGGALDTSNSSAYQEIVSKFLVEGWHVEIHAWLRALDDGAFLKKKVKRAAAQHVCTTLSCGDAHLKVVALPVAAPDAAQRAMEACGEDGAVKILSKAVPGGNDRKRQDQAEDGGAANAMNEQDQHQHSLHTSSWEELNAGDLIGNEAAIGLKTWVDAG